MRLTHAQTGGQNWWEAFFLLSCDGIPPRPALGGELVMQTNEHTNLRLIKQNIMLTFTQLELPHVSAVAMAGGSSGEAETEIRVSPATPLQHFLWTWTEEKEKEAREWKEGKQAEKVCSEQTEDNGVWVSSGVFVVIDPDRERERLGERARAGKNWEQEGGPSLSLGIAGCVCANRGGYLRKGEEGLTMVMTTIRWHSCVTY